ncbi:Hypothetical_protein [Hexamita inflata]|uniref:Hypothetical_protein n=1 Tax=Hexamita inflata TaxID=28002 RepID=A0AA86PMM5_9EUKA|nr:Hypothetical protein HINF_LOCUS30605 [Hexamita inflata]
MMEIQCLSRLKNISHQLYFHLYWFGLVFQFFESVKGMLLHLEEAPSEERVNDRFFCVFLGSRALAFLGLFLLGRQVLYSLCFNMSSMFSILFRDLIFTRIFRNDLQIQDFACRTTSLKVQIIQIDQNIQYKYF